MQKNNFIWFMRQAGRYLPEYLKTREEAGSFLDLCYNPELAAKVTLQPIDRFDFDAAIIFSDILVILDALGSKVSFIKGEGPLIKTDIDKFISENNTEEIIAEKITSNLQPVYQAIKITRLKLPSNKSLIGFSGAFWTLFSYLIEERGTKIFSLSKRFIYEEQQKLEKIKKIISHAIFIHLKNQIAAGCNIIKIFDSWASALSHEQVNNLVIDPTKEILEKLNSIKKQEKIICFPRGINNLDDFCKLDFDVIALDYSFDIKNAKNIYEKHGKTTQGNLDPFLLASNDQKSLETQVKHILEETKNIPHIFNLGHGILPHTPIKNVEKTIGIIRNF
jgi:uroporphyrinogen decarboxylase